MNRETRPVPSADHSVHAPQAEHLVPDADAERADDAAAIDADWPEREGLSQGTPPPDDGDNDASSFGRPVDADHVQDEGVAESLGKAVTAPVLGAENTVDSSQGEWR